MSNIVAIAAIYLVTAEATRDLVGEAIAEDDIVILRTRRVFYVVQNIQG